jgi:catechol 2,3-dioxygenase-like lactoylglutathione lyase family enzyme
MLMSKPTLNQINLVCGDLSASIAFYRRLGVEIPDMGFGTLLRVGIMPAPLPSQQIMLSISS